MADHSLNGYRHVWVVYDTDDFPHEHINRVAELCESESTDERTFHAIWSNQSIKDVKDAEKLRTTYDALINEVIQE